MDRKTGWSRGVLATALAALLTLAAALSQADETITYIHWDAQGSPVAATDEDGNVVWRESYRPYGERIDNEPAAGPHTRWYTGHPQDEDTGLIYAGARYYDPVIGRFLAVDPVDFQEGNLHSFNRYAYGSNNPYRYVDPDGGFSVDTGIDAGFVIYDSGRFLGAAAAYGVGTLTGDASLQEAGRQGMAETALDFSGSVLGMALPFVPSTLTRGVAKTTGGNVTEGIYDFTDTTGRKYCGQSCNVPKRLKRHIASGKLDPNQSVSTTDVLGGRTAREIAEHKRIQKITGGVPARRSNAVSNKVDPIGPNRRYLLDD